MPIGLSARAAPVHQMQEVYRYGTTDDCMGHWAALYRCLKRKTKFADQVIASLRHGAQGLRWHWPVYASLARLAGLRNRGTVCEYKLSCDCVIQVSDFSPHSGPQ